MGFRGSRVQIPPSRLSKVNASPRLSRWGFCLDPPGGVLLGLQLEVEPASPIPLAKIAEWLSAGTRLVWVIDPERRLARIYRQDGSESILGEDDALDGEDVLPGFSCNLSAVFETTV
jgi:hypothetical protein